MGSLLLALFSFFAAGQVLLLHGWLGDSSNWDESVRIMTAVLYNVDRQMILASLLPYGMTVAAWTMNITQ